MRLAITIAISTGARLSTVFTLRQKHFLASLDSDEPYKLIKIGGNSLVKNKNDKQMMLLIPRSVYFWAQTYITSPRYKKRLAVSEHEFKQSVHEYMFLKNNGKAYFMTERDANVVKYNKPPRGGDVQQFISKSLNTKLRQLKNGFQFRFHDLRATFGINILEWELRRLKYSDDRSDKELFNLLNFIRERMGHEKMATTEAYLRFHSSQARQQIVQAEYESYMLDWLQ